MELIEQQRTDRVALRQVKEWAAELLALLPEDSMSATELSCSEPDCPPHETVVLIARRGQPTVQLKVEKPAAEIRRLDLEVAIDSQGARPA